MYAVSGFSAAARVPYSVVSDLQEARDGARDNYPHPTTNLDDDGLTPTPVVGQKRANRPGDHFRGDQGEGDGRKGATNGRCWRRKRGVMRNGKRVQSCWQVQFQANRLRGNGAGGGFNPPKVRAFRNRIVCKNERRVTRTFCWRRRRAQTPLPNPRIDSVLRYELSRRGA